MTQTESIQITGWNGRKNRGIILSSFMAIQIVMVILLNAFDYSYIFPSQSGLTLGHQFLFFSIYTLAWVGGSIVAFRYFHWDIGAAHLMFPVFIFIGLIWWTSPRHYNAAEYQFLVGKTNAEVTEILGHTASSGNSKDKNGSYVDYNGMRIRYAVAPENGPFPELDDVAVAVEPSN